jgi:hypothetical protein
VFRSPISTVNTDPHANATAIMPIRATRSFIVVSSFRAGWRSPCYRSSNSTRSIVPANGNGDRRK